MSRAWLLSGTGGGVCGSRGCPSGTPVRRQRPVSDRDHDLVERGLWRLGATHPEGGAKLAQEPLDQRVVRRVIPDRHRGRCPSGPIDAEVGLAEAGLGAHPLRPEGLPFLGNLVGLTRGWLARTIRMYITIPPANTDDPPPRGGGIIPLPLGCEYWLRIRNQRPSARPS